MPAFMLYTVFKPQLKVTSASDGNLPLSSSYRVQLVDLIHRDGEISSLFFFSLFFLEIERVASFNIQLINSDKLCLTAHFSSEASSF